MIIVTPTSRMRWQSVYLFTDSSRIRGIIPHEIREGEVYTDGTVYDYVFSDDSIVADIVLLKAIVRLGGHTDIKEAYLDYLAIRHPTYSYH